MTELEINKLKSLRKLFEGGIKEIDAMLRDNEEVNSLPPLKPVKKETEKQAVERYRRHFSNKFR